MKPAVRLQGTAVVDWLAPGERVVVLPDGQVRGAASHADRLAVNAGFIDWRNGTRER